MNNKLCFTLIYFYIFKHNIIYPVDDCKKRWKNIKDTYNKKRRGRKLGTGSATREKPSKWILEDVLTFLDTAVYERQ